MKFSIAAISALILSSAITYTSGDAYADAMKSWCGGLSVTSPTASNVYVAGKKAKITVTRKADQRTKTITGLDLYSVASNGQAKYIKNVWKGSYALKTKATIYDIIPKNTAAGLYYYRVWVTNWIDGQHGPDCLQTSHTFKVTSGSHTNAAGMLEYAELLSDEKIYNPQYFEGCFGVNVKYPEEGSVYNLKDHVHIQVDKDSSSQADALTKVELYNGEELVSVAWTGHESFQNSFVLKDHLVLTHVDPSALYHYKIYTTSDKGEATCTFESNNFKIQQ
ncbi:hypothetical protein BDB01DRAFT_795066 [Pilobolus umbonatus]|nr:hypothetical protein BDB01DRAFT_795066 [Pilobolus umbonatus]